MSARNTAPPPSDGLERCEFGQTLDRLRQMGADPAQCAARLAAEPIDLAASKDRRQPRPGQERQQNNGERPCNPCQQCQHPGRDQHGDECRCHGMGVEILDRLDILGRERHQIAGAAPQQIGRCQTVELGEQRDAHLRQQAIGHVVRQPGFEPVQRCRHRRREQQRHQQAEDRLLRRDRRNHQSAENANADEGQHPADAAQDGQ